VGRRAAQAGIGWILLNRKVGYVEALRAEFPRLAVAEVTTDEVEIGRIQGRQLRALLREGGNVLYIQGPPDTSAAQERVAGAQETIAGARIEMKVRNGDWTETSGEKDQLTATVIIPSNSGLAVDLVAKHLRTGEPVPATTVIPPRSYPPEAERARSGG
jgi:ABC-type sugar transport system substrate-binding protein